MFINHNFKKLIHYTNRLSIKKNLDFIIYIIIILVSMVIIFYFCFVFYFIHFEIIFHIILDEFTEI